MHGSHTGAGGGQAATGAGFGRHQLQQPQPALLTATSTRPKTNDILFIASVSLQETVLDRTTLRDNRLFIVPAAACKQAVVGQSTIPGQSPCANATTKKLHASALPRTRSNAYISFAIQVRKTGFDRRWIDAPAKSV
jgi:hypothetical protein